MPKPSRLSALAALLIFSSFPSIVLASPQLSWGSGFSLEAYSDGSADIAEATVGLQLKWNQNISFSGDLLYEAGVGTSLESARLRYGLQDSSWHLLTGLNFIPFGNFTTTMVSKPLTLELGESAGNVILLGYSLGATDLGVYVFNSALQVNGNALAYGLQLRRQTSYGLLGLGIVSDIGNSTALQETIVANLGNNSVAAHVPGLNLHYVHEGKRHQWVAEYLRALGSFQAGEVGVSNVTPQALALEYGYNVTLLGKDSVLALGYQATDQASDLGLPRSRWLAAVSLHWNDHASLTLEYRLDTDYSASSLPGWTLQYHLAW